MMGFCFFLHWQTKTVNKNLRKVLLEAFNSKAQVNLINTVCWQSYCAWCCCSCCCWRCCCCWRWVCSAPRPQSRPPAPPSDMICESLDAQHSSWRRPGPLQKRMEESERITTHVRDRNVLCWLQFADVMLTSEKERGSELRRRRRAAPEDDAASARLSSAWHHTVLKGEATLAAAVLKHNLRA